MIKNYLQTAWRNLKKYKTFSLINILGLSIAMVSYLFIIEYTSFELSYDTFNKNARDIYRIYNDKYQSGKLTQQSTLTYSAVGKAMEDKFPEVIAHTRMCPMGKIVVNGYNGEKIDVEKCLFVDNSFLQMFSYTLLAGYPKTALTEPGSIVITQSMAQRLFNINNNKVASVLGKTISIEQPFKMLLKIAGVCIDPPKNSHLQFDFLYSYLSIYADKKGWQEADYDFTVSQFRHYIMLRPGADYKALEAKFSEFIKPQFQDKNNTGFVEKFYLQPLLKAHLYSDFQFDIAITSNATVVWGLFLIALLIMVTAWINYINFTTAKSIERAKEVGVRKVIGATSRQLVLQFLTETFIINIFSLVVALILVLIFQGTFNALIDKQLSVANLLEKSLGGYNFPAFLIAFILSGIFVSGLYSSYGIVTFSPTKLLKGRFFTSFKGLVVRKVLVVSQFSVAIILAISTLVVYRQMNFINNQKLGLNISQMLIVKAPEFTSWDSTLVPKFNLFINEIKEIPGVLGTANSTNLPGDELRTNENFRRNDMPAASNISIQDNFISTDFIELYQIKILAGRGFLQTDLQKDGFGLKNLVLNLTAIKALGYKSPQEAIGGKVLWSGNPFQIIGVVDDFHQKSMHYPIEPAMFVCGTDPSMRFSVKVNPQHVSSIIGLIKQKYNTLFPGNKFDYFFLDEKFNQQYSNDRLFGKMFGLFSSIAILIACIGLFGLSLFSTIQRTKEIGIRKVLGASASSIVILLSRDFIKLVLIAIIIAYPVAWYIMQNWLQNFVNRINLTFWLFILPGLFTAIIAFTTVGLQSIKTALAKPIKSLRFE
jgi:putative ABC transport system permease protein